MLIIIRDIQPISVNQSSGVYQGRIIKSKSFRNFNKEISLYLVKYRKELFQFAMNFNSVEHQIHASIEYHLPNLYSKKGAIIKRRFDIDNLNKAVLDAIFKPLEKINKDIDDAAITRLTCSKHESKNDNFITVINLELHHLK